MNMKKTILVIMTIVFALMFIACPDGKTPESNPPVANAQAEPTHTLADNLTITLDGTDSTGNISAYAWECETYTADQGTVSAEYTKAQVNALITNANADTATVKPRKAGTYVFKLTVTDNEGESDTDTVTVVVKGYTVPDTVTLTFSGLVAGASLDFTPSNIPAVVAYTLFDSTTTFDSNDGFNGVVNASSYTMGTVVTFIQTFYDKATSEPIIDHEIKVNVIPPPGSLTFSALRDASGSNLTSSYTLDLHFEKPVTELP